MTRLQAVLLKLIVAFAALVGVGSVWGMWFFSEELATEYPEFAFLRWPYFVAWVFLVTCCEAILAAIWALVRKVEQSTIFDTGSFRWVNVIVVAAFGILVVMCAALIPDVTITHGPPGFSLLLLIAIVASLGFALLMVVMRRLLYQATGFKAELDEVI
jgi:drug/metabolite transporter (DMT)-like permease